MGVSGIQHMQAAQLRDLVASLPGASTTRFLAASDANTYASSFDFAGHERPIADDDVAGWRMVAATMLAREQIRQAVGQLSRLDSIVIVDDPANTAQQVTHADGSTSTRTARTGWHKIEYWLGKREGSLTANTTGFIDDEAPETNMARLTFPRSGVEAASRAADLLAKQGGGVAALPAAEQRALQMYTSTAPHEAIHASTYNSDKIPAFDWQASVSVHPFTEGLAEAATSDNYRMFSDRILGPEAGYLSDATRATYGYAPGQLEPMRRIAALAGPEQAARVLLRNASAVRIGQQVQTLVREVAPKATIAQAEALATAAVTLAHDRAQRNTDSTQSAAAFDAALAEVAAAQSERQVSS